MSVQNRCQSVVQAVIFIVLASMFGVWIRPSFNLASILPNGCFLDDLEGKSLRLRLAWFVGGNMDEAKDGH